MTAITDKASPADWDNGPGMIMDGPYINKADEGALAQAGGYTYPGNLPYIGNYDTFESANTQLQTLFSPNRQISSPVMFGSLPVGLDHPWRTLLFRPAMLPGYQGSYTHPGGANPNIPDHLLLDFFRMPVVEPYAISEPLATAGKINLNTQIAPFTYISRTTGLRAVLKSVMITALNPSPVVTGSPGHSGPYVSYYKTDAHDATLTSSSTRLAIDLADTINQMTTLNDTTNAFPEFSRTTYSAAQPNFFISPSQICDVPLIPLSATGTQAYTNASLSTFWSANGLTGDNSLERPYSMIYPRVTTQSNTFTVHVRAQSLQKVPGNVEAATTWTEGLDQVVGEYRGSFTVERYFDPSNAAIYSTGNGASALTDLQDATVPTDARVVGAMSGNTVTPVFWRLLENKRFGQ
jgi:uncharacterized protein (TIGR02600 family)